VIFVQFSLFLLIGLCLYVYYKDTGAVPPKQTDRIYPEFIWNNLPPGIAGLIIAAILAAAMANLSAALNSLASTTVVDFFRARSRGISEARSLQIARLATVAWGMVLLAIAIGARSSKSVLEAGLRIGSIPLGPLLGVFLLGVLTRKPREGAAIAGVVAGLAAIFWIISRTTVAFTWYVLIGTTVTFTVGLLASFLQSAAPQE
jgi:SSS family solute:Na+ symporter